MEINDALNNLCSVSAVHDKEVLIYSLNNKSFHAQVYKEEEIIKVETQFGEGKDISTIEFPTPDTDAEFTLDELRVWERVHGVAIAMVKVVCNDMCTYLLYIIHGEETVTLLAQSNWLDMEYDLFKDNPLVLTKSLWGNLTTLKLGTEFKLKYLPDFANEKVTVPLHGSRGDSIFECRIATLKECIVIWTRNDDYSLVEFCDYSNYEHEETTLEVVASFKADKHVVQVVIDNGRMDVWDELRHREGQGWQVTTIIYEIDVDGDGSVNFVEWENWVDAESSREIEPWDSSCGWHFRTLDPK